MALTSIISSLGPADSQQQPSELPIQKNIVDRHSEPGAPIQTENQPKPQGGNQLIPSANLDPQAYAEAFRPCSRPTSAAGVAENYFATATTAEGIVSQKQSLPGPNTGNQLAAPSENRDLQTQGL